MAEVLDIALSLRRGGFALEAAQSLPLEGCTAVYGPSGSGKTTLLRAIAGLDRHAGGRITMAGTRWQDADVFVPPHLRRVGVVFQDARLFSNRDVGANLDYAARRARGPAPARDRVVDLLGLGGLLNRMPDALSGGEAQRVAIGRALLSAPRLLLLDEPVSALDAAARAQVIEVLAQVLQEFGIPAILVSHGVDEVLRLADRVCPIGDGRLGEAGDPATILSGQTQAYAVLNGSVEALDAAYGLMRVRVGANHLNLPLRHGVAAGQVVRVRIAATDVALSLDPPGRQSVRNVLAGTVGVLAHRDAVFCDVKVDLDGGQTLHARITRKAVDELALKPGARVHCLAKSAAVEARAGTDG